MGSDGFDYMYLDDLPDSAPSHNRYLMYLDDMLNFDDFESLNNEQVMSPTGVQPEAPISSQASNAKAARHKNYKHEVTAEAIDELRNQGLTLEAAAKVFEVSRSTLKRRLKEFGIPDWRLGRKNQGEYTVRVQDECGGSKGEFPIYGDTRFDTLRYQLGLKAGSNELVLEYECENDWIKIIDTAGLKLRLDELSQIREEAQRILVLRVRVSPYI